jgi:hypothetical protein
MSPLRSHRGRAPIIIFGCLIVLLLEGANLVRGDSIILPSNLVSGSQYQLIFVTADTKAATSAEIGDYNTFVTDQAAALSSKLPPDVTWYALASTETTDAKSNAILAGADDGIPIYNTHGELIANGISDLWESNINGKIQHAVKYDQFGDALPDETIVWTGSKSNGTKKYLPGSLAGPLGSPAPAESDDPHVVFGSSTSTTGTWMNRGGLVDFSEWHSLYALSSPITAIPEPGTPTLLCMGAAVFAFFRKKAFCFFMKNRMSPFRNCFHE